MFISQIQVRGFGPLINRKIDFAENRVTVICEPNEAGKSSLVDAIVHSFFAFNGDRRKRGVLRSLDKYQPWASPNGDEPYGVEMTVVMDDGRRLRLTSDFTRSQPLEVLDLDRGQTLEQNGQSFGERFFRMSLDCFTSTYVLRQKEGEGNAADLPALVERAAASTGSQGNMITAQKALGDLANVTSSHATLAPAPIKPETLLSRMEDALRGAEAELVRAAEEWERRADDMKAAAALDEEIAKLTHARNEVERRLTLSELYEVREHLNSLKESDERGRRHASLTAELEPFARFLTADRTLARSLADEARAARLRLDRARQSPASREEERLENLEEELAAFPPSMAGVTQTDADNLRWMARELPESNNGLKSLDTQIEIARREAREAGVPVENFEAMREKLSGIPTDDLRMLMDQESRRRDAEAEIATAAALLAEAETQTASTQSARAARRWKASTALIIFLTLGILAFVIALIGFPKSAMIGAMASLVAGAFGLWQMHLAQVESARDLEPALAREISAKGELGHIKERRDADDSTLLRTMARLQLDEETLQTIRQMSQWAIQLTPYHALMKLRDARTNSRENLLSDASIILGNVMPDVRLDEVNETILERAVLKVDDYLQKCRLKDQMGATTGERRLEMEAAATQLAEADGRLTAILDELLVPPGTREERTAVLEDGCEKARRFNELGPAPYTPSEQEISTAESRLALLETRAAKDAVTATVSDAAAAQGHDSLSAPAVLRDELNHLAHRREQVREDRARLFSECSRAADEWRQNQPLLQEKVDRLKTETTRQREFLEALTTTRKIMQGLADEIHANWAGGLNQRVNELLALINDDYFEMELNEKLEISVKARSTGQRMKGAELQHLSRGAHDQLKLVMRTAIAEFVAGGSGRLPLILDEPFAHWDDERFVNAMEMLNQLAERHQIIVLTCHGWRFDRLAEEHPDLAATLNRCSLNPTGQ